MATSKPRITITLEPHVYAVVSRLAHVSDQSMSSLIAGFLDVAVPPMERMVVVMEQALAAPEEARAGLAAAIAEAEARVVPQLLDAIGQSDMFLSDLAADNDRRAAPLPVRQRPVRAPRAESTPVPVTRGSGPGKRAARKGPSRG